MAWAKIHGAGIGRVFEELDESGARADRPLLTEALERVDRHESDGIVVAKLDRFGRSLIDGLANIERISSAGGTFISVQDGLDIGTPTGKLILRIMFSMAEWELDRVRQNWDSARALAVARGAHATAIPPFGYRHRRDRRLEVDRTTGPLVVELFRRRGAGQNFNELARFLTASPATTSAGNSYFSRTAAVRMIRNRIYLGELRSGSYLKVDAHPALVDRAIWQQAQMPVRPIGIRHRTLLGGLLRCATCRMGMYVSAPESPDVGQTYRCVGHSAGGACPDRATVRCDEIEPLVEEFILADVPRPSRSIATRTRRCEEKVVQAEADLDRYRDNPRLHATLGDRRYEAGLTRRQQTLEEAALRLSGVRRELASSEAAGSVGLEDRWGTLELVERRDVVAQRIEVIFVRPGSEPITERAYVCTSGTAPIDTPRRSRHAGPLRPFIPQEVLTVRLRDSRPWGVNKIERELREFLPGYRQWPTYSEFSIKGRARLFQQVMDFGGPYYWITRLGSDVRPRMVKWTDHRLERALVPIMKGRTRWPSAAEFDSFGMRRVRETASAHGGVRRWADHFGVDLRESRWHT